MKKINFKELEENIKEKKVTYLVFSAEWCGDCIFMKPTIEEIGKIFEKNNDFQLLLVDADESGIYKKESIYKVTNIPTHVFILNGKIQNTLYEFQPQEKLEEEIRKLLTK